MQGPRQLADRPCSRSSRGKRPRLSSRRFEDIALIGIQQWAARLTITLAADAPGRRDPDPDPRSAPLRRVAPRRDDLRRLRQGRRRRASIVNGKRWPLPRRCAGHADRLDRGTTRRCGSAAARSDQPFVGQLDDLRLYSRALTPEQIEQLALHYTSAAISRASTGKRTKRRSARPARLLSRPTRRRTPLRSGRTPS